MNMEQHPIGQYLWEAYQLMLKKNADYGKETDHFSNFRESLDMGISCSDGVAVRLSDKWCRFKNCVNSDGEMAVKDETVKDTCLDIMNYCAIYLALLEEEKNVK